MRDFQLGLERFILRTLTISRNDITPDASLKNCLNRKDLWTQNIKWQQIDQQMDPQFKAKEAIVIWKKIEDRNQAPLKDLEFLQNPTNPSKLRKIPKVRKKGSNINYYNTQEQTLNNSWLTIEYTRHQIYQYKFLIHNYDSNKRHFKFD